MSIFAVLALFLAQSGPPAEQCQTGTPECSEFEKMLESWKQRGAGKKPKPLATGPHTLLISHVRGSLARFDYSSGPACQRALDEMRKQTPQITLLTGVCIPR